MFSSLFPVPPSVFKSSPHTINVKKGSNYTLFCEGSGSPEPTVTWQKDGNLLADTRRTQVLGNQVKLLDISREDGGIYTCNFENAAGAISQPITVVVEGIMAGYANICLFGLSALFAPQQTSVESVVVFTNRTCPKAIHR
ncbi:protein turtle B [Elysia marginata]|uniref:Protein turtle B n=1 Tax=Elysia marginata TaxID=1093978 RepID=A0AAV4H6R5_9GAST|nr:protein turtle B [Elysia marginata]